MNIKRLVLGTAAGALAVTGAQAADLPVVVEPIDYVRVCDAYGVGYYFIPGTETCLRLAGRVRADYNIFFDLDDDPLLRPATVDPFYDIPQVFNPDVTGPRSFDAGEDHYRFRARGYIYLESRTATEFGLLRTFTEVQFTRDNAGGVDVNLDSAVIQFGGLIFGRTDSLYDFNDADLGPAQFFSYLHSDTKNNLIGYQFAFGNGFSAAISLEDHATRSSPILQVVGDDPGFFFARPFSSTLFDRRQNAGNDGIRSAIPDIVGNLRVDQGWGSAQVMAAGHEVDATGVTFNGFSPATGTYVVPTLRGNGLQDEYGFAVGAGVSVNVPFGTATTAALTGTYARGALSYAAAGAVGPGVADAVITPDGSLELGDFWSVSGGLATSFSPTVAASIQAGYLNVDQADVQLDPGGNAGLESLDFSNVHVGGFIGYTPVPGMTLGVGAQYRYVDTDDFGDVSGISTFFRAQRTF